MGYWFFRSGSGFQELLNIQKNGNFYTPEFSLSISVTATLLGIKDGPFFSDSLHFKTIIDRFMLTKLLL